MAGKPLSRTLRIGAHPVRLEVRGEGRPLLLLNGVGAPLELWDPLVERLSGVQTIAFDTPGSGRSPAPDWGLSIRGHAQLALDLLDKLGFGEVGVLGMSFGGMVAQELAYLAGSRVRRLVLASTSCGWGGLPGSPEALMALTTPDVYYARRLLGAHGRRPVDGEDRAIRARRRRSARPTSNSHGHLYQFWAAATWSSLPWLWQLPQPTLVLTGDRDTLVPPVNSQILATLLPAARLHLVPEGGHLCLFERAGEIAPVLDGFLTS